MSMIQMKPKDDLGLIAKCNDAVCEADTNILNVSANELTTVPSYYIDFNDYDSLEQIHSLLMTMDMSGLHLVSSDGVRVFNSQRMAQIVHGINEHIQSDFDTPLGMQMLFYDVVCLTRTCNLRGKVIQILQDTGYE